MVPPDPRQALRGVASRHDGQFTTAEAREAGVGRRALTCLSTRGEVESLARGLWRFTAAPGAPCSLTSSLLRCGPDAAVSHHSAARLHRLHRVTASALPHISVPRGVRRRIDGVVVHEARLLKPDVTVVGGLACTSLARTCLDLADPHDAWETLALLDDTIALGARQGWIHQRARALANGRGGVALIRDCTAPGAAPLFRSWLERATNTCLQAANLPLPQWNVEVRDSSGLIGIVDALWRPWRLVVEMEGLRFHTTPAQRQGDARRFNRLSEARYNVRRYTYRDLVEDPAAVVGSVARALAVAGAPVNPDALPTGIQLPPLLMG